MAKSSSLAIGNLVPVLITHVEFDRECCIGYGQFCDAEVVDSLSDKVLQAATSNSPIQNCAVGDIVLALYREDENWYRAKIIAVNGDALSVFFIDYGNSEVVSLSDVRIAPLDLKISPSLAQKCVLDDLNPSAGNIWSKSDKEKLHDDLVNKEFTAEVTDITSHGYVIALHTDTAQYQFGCKANSKNGKSLAAMNLNVGESYKSYIAYVDSANKFWIQLKQFELNLENLMQDIADYVESEAQPLPQAKRGTCCIAKFSEDFVPYRSKVLGITGDKCLVQFVDYGNSESKSLSDLMQIPEQFCQLPIQGFKCCYKRSKLKSNTLDDKVQELTSDEDGVVVTIISKSGDEYTVEIDKVEIISNADNIEVQAFTPLQIDLNKDFDVCISHVYHPGRFYVQIIENATIIDSLMDKISQDFNSSQPLSSLNVTTPCIAKLSDNACYRCVIKSKQNRTVFVLAVDFGFEEWVDETQVREISAKNIQIPAQALECTVDSTKTEEKYWSGKEIKILSELESKEALIAKVTAKRGSVFQLDLHDTKDPELDRYINAELLEVGKSADEKPAHNYVPYNTSKLRKEPVKIPAPEIVIGTKELLCVTAIKSSNQVYAQLTKHVDEIANLQQQLHATYESFSMSEGSLKSIGVGDVCCTKYADGGWYRGMVTSVEQAKIEVSFADFGDLISCNLTNLKEIMEKFAALPQQCVICELPNLNTGMTKETVETVLMNQVIEVLIKAKKEFPFPLYEVDFTSHPNNGKILQKLKGHPNVPRMPKPAMVNQISNSSFAETLDDYQATVVSLYSAEEVMVTHVIDPEHFHCQLKKYATQLDEVMQSLDEHCKKLGVDDDCIENIHLGQPCLAKFSADESWYRARITGILAGKNLVEVLYVDYGNTECQDKDGLKCVKPKFMNLPAQAIFCGLSGVAASQGYWSPEHITQFEDHTLDQNFNTVFKKWNKDENLYSVEMTTLTGESFNLKFGSMSNSLCLEQSDDSGHKRSVEFSGDNDMMVKVGSGFGAASRSFGGRDSDRGSRSGTFGDRRAERSSGFGGDGGGQSSGFGGERGGKRGGFGGDRGGGRGGFGGDRGGRSSGFGGGFAKSDKDADEDWGNGPTASSSGFGSGGRSFGNERGGRSFGGDRGRGGRSGGFGRDEDKKGGFDSNRGGRGGFGGGRGGRSGGFGRDQEDEGSDSGFGGKRGGFGGGRGGGSSGFRRDHDDSSDSSFGGRGGRDRGGRGGFGGDRGGRNTGFRRDQGDNNEGSDSGFGGRRGGFKEDRGGRGSFGGDRGGSRGGRGGFGGDRGSSDSDRGGRSSGFGGRGGGFGGDRGGRGGGFGGNQGSRGGGFGSDRGGRGGGFGGGRGGGFGGDQGGGGFSGSSVKQSVDEDWGDDSPSVPVKQPGSIGFGKAAGDSWDVKSETNSSMINSASGGGGDDDRWTHKNLNRFESQKLVLGKTIKASIVYSNSPVEFWCQCLDQVSALETLSEKMNNEYNSLSGNELSIDKPEVKDPCIAKFSEDEQWYRAEIISITGNDLEVYFVDYGNTEVISKSSTKKIKREYFSLPVQGIRCSLNNIHFAGNSWSEKCKEDFSSLTTDKDMEIRLICLTSGTYQVELKDLESNSDIGAKLVELGHAIHTAGSKKVVNPYPCKVFAKDEIVEAFVSSIDNPHHFYIQPASTVDDLEELVTKIQEEYTSGLSANNTLEAADIGAPVIAQFSDDDAWYRAFVESISGKKYCVRFIDYGNSDTVELDKLRKPTEELLNIISHAVKCKLYGVKPLQSGSWNVDSKDIMEGLVSGDDSVVCFIKVSDKNEHVIEITAGSKKIAEELIGAAVARKEESKPETAEASTDKLSVKPVKSLPNRSFEFGTEVKAFVSSIKSPSKYFIQLAKEEDDLEILANSLQSSYNEYPGESTTVADKGEFYCTKYTEDNMWYRAVVEEVVGEIVTVCFIDYGNFEDVKMTDLKLLKADFIKLPSFAIKCCLSGIEPIGGQWSENAITAFEEAVLDKELTVTFTTESQVSMCNDEGDIAQCLINGKHGKVGSLSDSASFKPLVISVENQTMPEGEIPVYISSVEEKAFYLQLASHETELQIMADLLQSLCPILQPVNSASLSVGDNCCGKFKEDDQWYRAVVDKIEEDQAVITFIDYGNGETLPIDSLKYLNNDILAPAMAFHCTLDGCENVDPTVLEPRLSALTESTGLKAVFSGVTNKIFKVVLKEDNKSINEELSDKGEVLTEGGMVILDETGDEQIISEVEDAPEPVVNSINELKPETLKEGQRIEVVLTHVDSPSKFYVHVNGNTPKIDALLDDMYNFYSHLNEDQYRISKVEPGTVCAAKFSEDESWYRAKVISVEGETIHVIFLDHGNSEDIMINSIKQLMTKFCELPIQGIPCILSGIGAPGGSWREDDTNLFKELTEDKSLLAEVVGWGKSKSYIVQLLDMGISVGQSMINKAHGIVATTPRVNTKIRRVFSDSSDVASPLKLKMPSLTEEDSIMEESFYGYSLPSFESGQEYRVKVSQIENPTCFWCQIVDPQDKLQQLVDSLQEKYKDSKDIVDKIDTACVAKCRGDGLFYRGVTRSNAEDGEMTVLFVDYGSLYCVKVEDVKAIEPEDFELPIQAVDCMLHDIDLDESQDDWEQEACEYFEELCDNKELKMTVKQTCIEGLSVYLHDGDINIGVQLADRGFVSLLSHEEVTPVKSSPKNEDNLFGQLLSADSEYQVTISHVVNPSNFYVLFEDNALESIEEKLNQHLSINPNDELTEEDMKVGMLCLALCVGVNDWQRAKIESVEEDSAMVHYIDIGNKELVKKNNLKKIPECLSSYPPQIYLCEIDDIKPVGDLKEWPNDTVLYFQDICTPGEEMVIYLCDVNEDKLKVSLYDGKLKTFKEQDQQIGIQLVKLGFADCVPGSHMEEIIKEEENSEPLFNEMSLNRENSYGSTEEQDTSALGDESSICQGDTTADLSTVPDDSTLDTTASDSFAYVDFKPFPKVEGECLENITTKKDEEDDDEFYDAEDEKEASKVCEEIVEKLVDGSLVKGDAIIVGNEVNEIESTNTQSRNEIGKEPNKDDEVEAESDEEDTVKCVSDDEQGKSGETKDKTDKQEVNGNKDNTDNVVKEIDEKLVECHIEDEREISDAENRVDRGTVELTTEKLDSEDQADSEQSKDQDVKSDIRDVDEIDEKLGEFCIEDKKEMTLDTEMERKEDIEIEKTAESEIDFQKNINLGSEEIKMPLEEELVTSENESNVNDLKTPGSEEKESHIGTKESQESEQKILVEQFIKHSVEEVAVEKYKQELLEQQETEQSDSVNNNVNTPEVCGDRDIGEHVVDSGSSEVQESTIDKDDTVDKADNSSKDSECQNGNIDNKIKSGVDIIGEVKELNEKDACLENGGISQESDVLDEVTERDARTDDN